MKYKEATIYYMTGTGNSYRAAAWMAEAAGDQGAAARVIPYEEGRPDDEVKEGPENILGIVFPTHGFTAPWSIICFAWRLPRRRETHAFVAPTRGGVKIGRYCLPGGECSAAYLIALLLLLRGYSVRGIMGLDMPLNWMSLFPGLHPKNVEVIASRANTKATRFMETILSGQRRCISIDSSIQLFFGLLLLPISIAYLLVGRFFLAKLFFANNLCNGCGLCVENCPKGALLMQGRNKPRPYWTFHCESCMRCMGYCPQKAVEASQSFGVILYYVTMIPVSVYIMNYFSGIWPQAGNLDNYWTRLVLFQYPYTLASIFFAYFLFSLLIRISFFNKLFAYTTFTRLYRRYHEPETNLKDIHVDS